MHTLPYCSPLTRLVPHIRTIKQPASRDHPLTALTHIGQSQDKKRDFWPVSGQNPSVWPVSGQNPPVWPVDRTIAACGHMPSQWCPPRAVAFGLPPPCGPRRAADTATEHHAGPSDASDLPQSPFDTSSPSMPRQFPSSPRHRHYALSSSHRPVSTHARPSPTLASLKTPSWD